MILLCTNILLILELFESAILEMISLWVNKCTFTCLKVNLPKNYLLSYIIYIYIYIYIYII